MSHSKLREGKQQQNRARSGHHISCCLVSLHFLCDILSSRPVDLFHPQCPPRQQFAVFHTSSVTVMKTCYKFHLGQLLTWVRARYLSHSSGCLLLLLVEVQHVERGEEGGDNDEIRLRD